MTKPVSHTDKIHKLEEQIAQNTKNITMLELIILRHESAQITFRNDIAVLQRLQKNSYGLK